MRVEGEIYYDWLEFNKVKRNINLALRPTLVVLTRFFITTHSVYEILANHNITKFLPIIIYLTFITADSVYYK